MKLRFEKLSRFLRSNEPVAVAVPLAKGVLTDTSLARIVDGDRVLRPQAKPTAYWPDGSVKWLHVCFAVDLPGNAAKDVSLSFDAPQPTVPPPSLIAEELLIKNNALSATLSSKGGFTLFSTFESHDECYAANDFPTPVLIAGGKRYQARIDSGWTWKETGPYRATASASGRHVDASGGTCFSFEIELSFFGDHPWFEIEYRFINTEDTPSVDMEALYMDICPGFGAGKAALGHSNYETTICEAAAEEGVSFTITDEFLLYEANEQVPETLYGTFFTDIVNDAHGVCATIFQAQQNFPKALRSDKNGVRISLFPENHKPLTILQGVSKTHRMLIHMHGPEESVNELNIRSLQYQMPDRPLVGSDAYRESGVLGDIFPDTVDWAFERKIVSLAEGVGKAYGMLHWGDFPDSNYTGQGRGNGALVWANNEYDTPRAYHCLYARTMARRYLDRLFVSAEHWMDVDICHHSSDPLRFGAQIMHCAGHVSQYAIPSHEWVDGLLDYYHLTGKERALACAIGIGENVTRLLEQPVFQQKGEICARETGWALRTFTALYIETGADKWLDKCEWIVNHFRQWKEEFGEWLSPYTDHTAVRVPFMIAIAASSLMRYHRIRPSESVRSMIIGAMDDLLENSLLPSGEFYYKELPSLAMPAGIATVLEALVYAYELTGDAKYIEGGITTYRNCVESSRERHGLGKDIVGDAVLVQGSSPKIVGEWHLPLVLFNKYLQACGGINKLV